MSYDLVPVDRGALHSAADAGLVVMQEAAPRTLA